MLLNLVLFFVLSFVALSTVQAQTGPCTESAIKEGHVPVADDAFSYMPPYGKPVVGKSEIQTANNKSFSDRTNVTHSWVGEHRIVSTPAADMAYEYGTLAMGYDDKGDGKHHDFKAVMLMVYRTSGGVCKQVASTMQPLEE